MTDFRSAIQGATDTAARNSSAQSKYRNDLTAERLRELLYYNPDTGGFRWKTGRGGEKAGSEAGGLHNGYIKIAINRCKYRAHRLAWLYTHGEWPSADLDHVDRDKTNNRISNLRPATGTENNWNKSAQVNSVLGIKGVTYYRRRQKYQAQIGFGGAETLHLGYYDTPYQAAIAYRNAARGIQGEFACLQDEFEVRRLSDLEMERRATEAKQAA
jgi:hypothetical protein